MKPRFPLLTLIAMSVAPITLSLAADSQPQQELSLRAAMEQALAQNLGLRIQALAPKIAQEAVIDQEAAFDPTLTSRVTLAQDELNWEDTDSNDQLIDVGSTSDSRNYSVGLSKRIATGGRLSANANQSRSDGSSFNAEFGQRVGGSFSERTSLSLNFTQPLLRDFGSAVNLAPLRSAESRARVADLRTRNSILDLLQETENAYWRLSDAYQRRDLRLSNLQLSQKLLEEASERERLGLATKIDTLQAEANLAQRKEQIIRAEQAIRDATDSLLATMGVLDETSAIEPQVAVSAFPTDEASIRPFPSVLETALQLNFDTDIQEEVLEQLEQQRILERNRKRPQVDLNLSKSYNGLARLRGINSFDEALDRRGDDWGIGVSFTLPWGSRSAKSNLRQTLYQIDQQELRLAEIKQDLLRSVRAAWRDLDASSQQRSAAQLVVDLQEATYEQETGKYEQGLSTFRALLETQRDLDQAKLSLLDARLATVQAEITLARVEGSLLERHGIEWNAALPEQN